MIHTLRRLTDGRGSVARALPSFMKWLGYLLTAASLIFLIIALRTHFDTMPENVVERYANASFAISVALFVSSVSCGFLIWHCLLNYERINLAILASANVYFLSQIGKYLPGNVAQHVGRVILASKRKIAVATTTKLIVVEVIVVVAAATLFVLAICVFSESLRSRMLAAVNSSLGLAGTVLAVALLAALAFMGILMRLRTVSNPDGREGGTRILTFRRLLPLASLGLVAFIALGASFQLLLTGCLQVVDPGLYTCIVWITSSWLISFFTPGAPAGLGIREVVLISLISVDYGQSVALEAALAFRGVSVMGDVVVLAIGLLTSLAGGEARREVKIGHHTRGGA